MKYLIVLIFLATSIPSMADDGFHFSVGIGIHDPSYDWHIPAKDVIPPENVNDAYASNPIGIVKLTWGNGPWIIGYEHLSSIPNKHDDHGINMLSLTFQIF